MTKILCLGYESFKTRVRPRYTIITSIGFISFTVVSTIKIITKKNHKLFLKSNLLNIIQKEKTYESQ